MAGYKYNFFYLNLICIPIYKGQCLQSVSHVKARHTQLRNKTKTAINVRRIFDDF